jgi:aryl-alcohol dehydrogenase-like predicted oxidoreductase
MLDRFLEAGGTFIDTADVYGDGESERTLAPWLARHRGEVVLATKVRFAVSDPGGEGLGPDRIRAACDASLRRLGVDVIDLYQVHAFPLEDTLAALDGLVQAGKVRALGASNFPAWLLAWAVSAQDREGWAPFVSLQPQYSLVERSAELELLPFCRASCRGDRSGLASSPVDIPVRTCQLMGASPSLATTWKSRQLVEPSSAISGS